MHKLYTDGSILFQYNKAGIGGYITNEADEVIHTFDKDISNHPTVHLHETLAFVEGLKHALNLGIKDLQCYMDDQGLANVLSLPALKEKHIVANPHIPEALELISRFDTCSVGHVFREKNRRADLLSRKYADQLVTDKENMQQKIIHEATVIDPANPYIKQYNNQSYCMVPQLYSTKNNPKQKSLYKQFGETSTVIFIETVKIEKGIEIKIIKKSDPEILLAENLVTHDLTKNVLSLLTKELEKMPETKIWLDFNRMARGIVRETMDQVLNLQPIKPKKFNLVNRFVTQLQKFDQIVIATTPGTALAESNKTLPPEALLDENNIHLKSIKRDKTPDFLEAMKKLGSHLYRIGMDEDLETRFKILPEKKNDIAEIQRKYFNCYTEAKIREKIIELKKPFTLQEKQEIEKQTKDSLLSKGINLRF